MNHKETKDWRQTEFKAGKHDTALLWLQRAKEGIYTVSIHR